jgi:hypothetical protein
MVKIAQRDYPFALATLKVMLSHAADTHGSDREGIARRLIAGSQNMTRDHECGKPASQEAAPGHCAAGGVARTFAVVGICRCL